MKKNKFIAIVVLSAAIAFGIGVGVLALTGSAKAFAAVSIFGAIAFALGMGAFDVPAKVDSIKRFRRNYGRQAAIFVGGACLFMGSPKECQELADDLWHRGVQAEVGEITDEMQLNIL